MIARLLIVLPVLAAAAAMALRRNDIGVRAACVGTGLVMAVLAFVGMVAGLGRAPEVVSTISGVTLPDLRMPWLLWTSPAIGVVTFVVAGVAAVIQAYAAWYLATDDRYATFAATMSLFTAAMLLVVQSADLTLTLIGWEVMGWCSFLLIGHWSRTEVARRAAAKALLVTRAADVGFVLGLVGLAVGARSTGLADVLAYWTSPEAPVNARALALSLVVVGVLGKSAQFPFHDWLPDAMAGPTPASALIHAATMVAAGTVVLWALYPAFVLAEPARWLLGVSASITMLVAALLAFAQSDLKRLLAYSTVSQVALMLGAIAAVPAQVGPDAGLFHLLSHALFKALLFLVIGWLAVVVGSTAASAMRGSARADWVSRVALFVGLAALAGVPLFVGGVSKELVVEGAFEGAVSPSGPGVVVLVVILLTVVVTAAYSTRAFIVVTTHRPGGAPTRRTMPWSVATVLAVLTVATTLGGVLALTGAFVLPSSSWVWLAISVLLITVGVSVAWRAGLRGDPAEELAGRFIPYADRGLGVDRLYTDLVARPVLAAAAVARFLDTEVIDAYVRATAFTARLTGTGVVRAHRGERPAVGTALVALGVLVVGIVGVMTWS